MLADELILLAIDTCGAAGSVALGSLSLTGAPASGLQVPGLPGPGPIRVLATAELKGKTFSALLISSIEDILHTAQLTLSQVDALIVVNGPGSFTGVRIGVATAKGLAEGLAAARPAAPGIARSGPAVIAVSSLELLARQHSADACAALDAGRGDLYFGVYRGGVRLVETLYTPDEVRTAESNFNLPLLVCEDAPAAALPGALRVATPTAVDALSLAIERLHTSTFADVATLDGNYLRRPDAENSLPEPQPASTS